MAGSLANQAYEAIRDDILKCVLEPGQTIAQGQLADEYGFGLTPIREALQRLTQEGFVEPIHRQGFVVTQITMDDVYEIYTLRSILEIAAVRLAVKSGSQRQLRRVKKIAESSEFTYVHKDPHTYSDYLEKNTDYHLAIAAATGNGRLVNALSSVLDELARVLYLYIGDRDRATNLREEHVTLAEALCERDVERAERLIQAQISSSLRRVLSALEHQMLVGASGSLIQMLSTSPDKAIPPDVAEGSDLEKLNR